MPLVPADLRPPKRVVMSAIYAELVRMDAEGNFIPYLASSVPTLENGLVQFVGSGEDQYLEVTFDLRPNLTWHDGAPLTAADLVFSREYALSPDWPDEWYSDVSRWYPELYVSSVEAPEPDRVIYRFMSQREVREAAQSGGRISDPTPYADFVRHEGPVVPLDYPLVGRHVYPEHLLHDIPPEQLADSDFAAQPVYAGPYRVAAALRADQPVVLDAFPDFVLGKPPVARVVFGASYSFPNAEPYWQTPEVLAEAFDANALGAQLGFPIVRSREGSDPRAHDRLAEREDVEVEWAAWNAWETLDFNLDNPHLADLRVRQAIAHAIDRQAIIDLALAGHGRLMQSYLPDWHPLYAANGLPAYAYDPERARMLLVEAGYDVSQTPALHAERGPLSLHLDSMDVAPYARQPTAELIKSQLAAIGIGLDVQFHTWEAFEGQDCSAIRNGRRFDLAMAGWLGASNRYPIGFVEQALVSASIPTTENGCPYLKSNWTGWQNTEADALVERLKDGRLALEQPQAYRDAWAEHQRLWATDLPSIPLFNVERSITISTRLTGVRPSPFAVALGVEETWNIHEWQWQGR